MAAFWAMLCGTIMLADFTFVLKKRRMENKFAVLFTSPPSPSSPKIKRSGKLFCFCRAIKSAIARSKWLPDFGVSEGDKFIVIFKDGKLKPRLKSADFTRSPLSFMLLLASPTMLIAGKALVKLASISTMSRPLS